MGVKKYVFLIALPLLTVAIVANAQNSRDPSQNSGTSATTVEPKHQRDAFTHHKVKPFKWKRQKVTHTAQYEYYRRVELAAKEHQRVLRKLHKPQYMDFLYYGHKRKPVKHPPGKLRYCKECGIRH